MVIGAIFFQKKYTWYKYLSVLLLCSGCILFSSGKKGGKENNFTVNEQLFGVFLVGINLFLDGYTNNEQDQIFKKYKISGIEMMKYINIWQAIYLLIYLIILWFYYKESSELYGAIIALLNSHEIQYDIILFCICAGLGQVLIFAVMKEFGSLTWITISITRKLFTVLLSVFAFNHVMKLNQWLGIIFVFTGLSIDMVMSYFNKKKVTNIPSDDKINKPTDKKTQ
jgi:UDP-galactose transporter B1